MSKDCQPNKILRYMRLTDFKWLNLFQLTYLNKKGEEDSWMMVSRKNLPFREKGKTDAVMVVCFLSGKLVLIKQYRPAIDEYLIESVAGLMDEDIPVIDMAIKEVKEEVGLEVKTYKLFSHPIYNSPGITNENIVCVIAEVEGEPTTKYNEDSEDIEIIIVDRKEAKQLLNSGAAISAKTWFVLYAYANGFNWLKE